VILEKGDGERATAERGHGASTGAGERKPKDPAGAISNFCSYSRPLTPSAPHPPPRPLPRHPAPAPPPPPPTFPTRQLFHTLTPLAALPSPTPQTRSSVKEELWQAAETERRRRREAVENFYAEQLHLLQEQVRMENEIKLLALTFTRTVLDAVIPPNRHPSGPLPPYV
jgi:hypothetical protein